MLTPPLIIEGIFRSTVYAVHQGRQTRRKPVIPQRKRMRNLALSLLCFSCNLFPAPPKTENIIFVMTDGLRWQEVFHGGEPVLMTKQAGVADPAALARAYAGDDFQDRRKKLMPFVWSTIAASGQIYGDRDQHADAVLTNGLDFSYPGYSEALCGFADPRVASNAKVFNPNKTVLEWLNQQPPFRGRIAAFAAWDVFPFILNAPLFHFPVNAGYDPFELLPASPEITLLNHMKQDQPRLWEDEPFDALPFYTALEYLKMRKPRILFLSLGETDEWAHSGRYDLYLDAAHRADHDLEVLWQTISSMPEYRGHTSLIFGTDHGRGSGVLWSTHGAKAPESKDIFMMFLGPDTPPLGNRSHVRTVTQSQIAATMAALLGLNYNRAVPHSGRPLADVAPPALLK